MYSTIKLIRQQRRSLSSQQQGFSYIKQQNSNQIMSNTDSLSQMLKDDNLTVQRLFSTKNIVTDIKNNIQTFISYSLRHKQFIFSCLQIALQTSLTDLEKLDYQNIAFNICEIICSDQPVIADLFFEPTVKTNQSRKNSQISQSIEGQESETIQSQAERLFEDDEEDVLKKVEKRPIQIERNEVAKKSLQVLKKLNNESSLGYLYKIWSFLIRNNSDQVIEFLQSNREYFDLLFNNLRYPSVSNLIAQVIICQDKNKEYKYEAFKKQIIQKVIAVLITQKEDSDIYQGVSILLEEVFNSSKQSYCENFDDFKRQVNYFFSSGVILKLYNILLENQQKSFQNVLKYFELLFNRINSDAEDYLNYREQNNGSFVKFETQLLITNFSLLISKLKEIQSFSSVVKISYVSVLLQIVQSTQFKRLKSQLNFIELFQKLMIIFSEQKSKGLYKMKLSKLVEQIIKNCNKEDIEEFVSKNQNFLIKYYPSIQSVNMENSRVYNKNELIGFECQILFQIENKLPGVVDTSQKIHQKNLKRMQKKYETKIANYGRPNQQVNLQEVGSFTFNQIPGLRLPEGFKINNFNTERKGQQSGRNTGSNRSIQQKKENDSKQQKKLVGGGQGDLVVEEKKAQSIIIRIEDSEGNKSEVNKGNVDKNGSKKQQSEYREQKRDNRHQKGDNNKSGQEVKEVKVEKDGVIVQKRQEHGVSFYLKHHLLFI